MKKNILITGSTDGIGKLAAIDLAKDGHVLFLHGRNPDKLKSTISEIMRDTGNAEVSGFVADFSDLQDVQKMVNEIVEQIPVLDVLINNAGIYNSEVPVNKDGLDIRMVVNYFAPKVLTTGILPQLKKSVAPRVLNIGSAAQSSVSDKLLDGRARVSESSAYAQSKLALTMWSFDLAKEEKDIVVIAVNPGSRLNTKMVAEAFDKHWSPADKGGDLLYDLAISDEFNDASGKYFDNDKGAQRGRFSEAHQDAYDKEKRDDVRRNTAEVLKNL